MGERDDELGLGLSLSLGCVGGRGGYGGHEKKQQQPALKLNEMPFPANNHFMPRNTPRKSSWNDLSQYPSDGSANTRSFWKGLDMNQVPRVTECEVDETTRVSSPNSTISSISGKRSEREPINEEAEADAERASCSRVSDEEDGSGDASRKKLRLSKEQSLLLEEAFKEHNTLNPKQKLALAKQLNLQPRQVEVWFQNRRARSKLKQTEVDCEYLKRCCKNLTEENRRLQKEVQELRALKLSPQLYMHMNPPTTLTMCPSCERVAVSSSSAVSSSAAASSSLASSGQSRLPMGPNHQGPVAINPWAAMPIPHRPFSGSTTRS